MPNMIKKVQQMRTMLPIGFKLDNSVWTTSFRPGALKWAILNIDIVFCERFTDWSLWEVWALGRAWRLSTSQRSCSSSQRSPWWWHLTIYLIIHRSHLDFENSSYQLTRWSPRCRPSCSNCPWSKLSRQTRNNLQSPWGPSRWQRRWWRRGWGS